MRTPSKKSPHRKPAPIFRGRIEKCALVIDGAIAYRDYLRSMEGKNVEVVVRQQSGGRSMEQNRFYWGVCVPLLCEHTGYLPEELHAELKKKLLTVHYGQDDELSIVGSTAALDQQQFAIFLDQVIKLAAEMDCIIPDPQRVDI